MRSLFQYLPANPVAFTLSVVVAWCLASCGGNAYRQNADKDVKVLLQDIPEFGIEANESSRLRNPSAEDFPPIPRDDSAARSVSEAVLGKDVYPDGNSTTKLESETWRDWLPLDKDGQVNLNLPVAVKLALTHSPDFQREKEDLYLSALDVTYERFRLDPKPFLDGSTKLDRSGVAGDTDGVSSIRSGLTAPATNRWSVR